MNIQIKIQNLDEVKKGLNEAPIFFAKNIDKAIHHSIEEVRKNVLDYAPSGAGNDLRLRWDTIFKPLYGALISGVKHGIFVHEGTKPHWTSIKNLADWARLRGLNVYALQRSIAKKGTKANPFLAKAVDAAENKINQFFKEAVEKSLEDIAAAAK